MKTDYTHFIYVDDDGHFKLFGLLNRTEIWDLIYNNKYEYYFSDRRFNDNLPFYGMQEFVILEDEQFLETLDEYTDRGRCALIKERL